MDTKIASIHIIIVLLWGKWKAAIVKTIAQGDSF